MYKNKNAIFPQFELLIGDLQAGVSAPGAGCGRAPLQPHAGAGAPGAAGPGQEPAFVRAAGEGAPGPGSGPAVTDPRQNLRPRSRGSRGPFPAAGTGQRCPDSRIVPPRRPAPPRAGNRGRAAAPGGGVAISLPGPRRSAALRARPLSPAPWEAKVIACARSGSRPLPRWKSGSSVPYLSSV